MTTIILGISTILQFVVAFLSVRLISITGRWAAWTLFAIAMTLMGVRRSITLYRTITGDIAYPTDLTAELVALSISVLMLSGVLLISPIFRKIQSANKKLQLSEEKYREVVNFLPQIIYEADMQVSKLSVKYPEKQIKTQMLRNFLSRKIESVAEKIYKKCFREKL